MDGTHSPQTTGAREALQAQANREELLERMARLLREDGMLQPLTGLYLHRATSPLKPTHAVMEPCFCVIAQGSKEIVLGDSTYRYDPFHYLLATVDLPTVGRILEASKAQPYFSIRLNLDPVLVSSVMVEAGYHGLPTPPDARAMDVSPLDLTLLDAILRLIRLLDSPTEARVLKPLIIREIIYRLLVGEQSRRLRHVALVGGYPPHIAGVIKRLRQNFDQPLRVEQLAQDIGMSVSGFHHQFKAVTAMSPLQFQKRLRLQEARRLMLGEGLDAASAGYRVGYQDASHFNREYKGFFGVPPMRDVQRLREAASA